MRRIFASLLLLSLGIHLQAQENQEAKNAGISDSSTKTKKTLTIGSDGIYIGKEKKNDTTDKAFDIQFGMLDLGINYMDDKTDYNNTDAKDFLRVNEEMKNKNLFSLREGKSINVNVWPLLLKYRMVKTKGQRIYLTTGVGLQMYNFRFNKPITYTNIDKPYVDTTSLSLSKNKLGFTYLSVPLMLTFKTRLFDTKSTDDIWLVYGFGITAGYRIASWTKQISSEKGKQKNHDAFNFSDFNSCITGEIGIEGYIRLFASYQLTALHTDALDQHPYTVGFRLLGI